MAVPGLRFQKMEVARQVAASWSRWRIVVAFHQGVRFSLQAATAPGWPSTLKAGQSHWMAIVEGLLAAALSRPLEQVARCSPADIAVALIDRSLEYAYSLL